jgi:hypothetical protein
MDEAVSDTERNTYATSYVTADNSRSMAYLILKVICKWKNKDRSTVKSCLFTYKVHLFQYKSQFNKVFNVNPGENLLLYNSILILRNMQIDTDLFQPTRLFIICLFRILLSLLYLFLPSEGVLIRCNHTGWGPLLVVLTQLTKIGK